MFFMLVAETPMEIFLVVAAVAGGFLLFAISESGPRVDRRGSQPSALAAMTNRPTGFCPPFGCKEASTVRSGGVDMCVGRRRVA
jgi:hypothetical protein